MTEIPNFLRPETYLSPRDLADVDQWETALRDHCDETVQMLCDITETDGPQSVVVWAKLFESHVPIERLAAITAHYLVREANRRFEGSSGAAS